MRTGALSVELYPSYQEARCRWFHDFRHKMPRLSSIPLRRYSACFVVTGVLHIWRTPHPLTLPDSPRLRTSDTPTTPYRSGLAGWYDPGPRHHPLVFPRPAFPSPPEGGVRASASGFPQDLQLRPSLPPFDGSPVAGTARLACCDLVWANPGLAEDR